MNTKVITANGISVAILSDADGIIQDGASAMDLLAAINYETGCDRIIMPKAALTEAFFDLRTGVAGEIAQKIVNYRKTLAVIGDFSGYESRSLRDYIYECNQRGPVYFLPTEEDAFIRLGIK